MKIIEISLFGILCLFSQIQCFFGPSQSPSQNCTELFPRLFFKNVTMDQDGHIIMSVKFNTNDPCNKSYVNVEHRYSISRYSCQTQLMQITQNKTFIHYIHTCQIKVKGDEDTFKYTCYGQQKTNNLKKFTKQYQVNIPHPSRSLNIIALADWAPIEVRPYIPIYSMLTKMIEDNSEYNLNAIMIVGDIAYDLHFDDCQKFVKFMTELSAVSPYLPIIPIAGNHQLWPPSEEIFYRNFEAEQLSKNPRVKVFPFWNMNIVSFNPGFQIYGVATETDYRLMKTNLLQKINLPSDFTIVSSHYPLICSQIEDDHCGKTLETMPDLFKQMSESKKVDLYIGAHMHQYERVHPYIDGDFKNIQSPYQRGMMPSVVEGVAGCDYGIIDKDYPTKNFSIYHTYNKTGFGLMKISGFTQKKISLEFSQLVTVPAFDVVDKFKIESQPQILKNS